MDVFDLKGTISLDRSKFDSGLLSAKTNMGQFGSELLGKFGAKGLITMGVAAGFALLAKKAFDFTAESVKVGMEFDKSMSQVAATMGKSVEEMNNEVITAQTSTGEFTGTLRDFAQEMGRTTAFSATEASEALNYMALAGYDAKTSMEMLPNVLNLAAAGNMELAQSSDMVTDAQSALGLNIDETNQLVDKMAKTASITNTDVGQLGEAILRIGGTAKNMAGGTTELTGALGLLASAGTKGAEGGTALRNVLLNIQSSKFEKAFSSMGVSAYDAEGNLRSLKDIFGDMNKAMEGMTQQEKDKILTKVFDRRTLKDANTLLSTSAEQWDKVTGAIDKSKGAADKMAETQLDNLSGDVTKFKSAWEGLQLAVSEKVTPALRGITKAGTEAVSDLVESFKAGDIIGGIVTLMSNLATKIAEYAPMLIPAALTLVENLVVGLVNALPKLVSGAVSMVSTFVKSIISKAPLMVGAALKLVGRLAGAIITNAPKLVVAAFKMIPSIVKGIIKGVPQMVKNGAKLTKELWNGMKSWFGTLKEKLGEKIKEIPKKVKEAVSDLIQAGKDLIAGLWEGIKEAWKDFKKKWSDKVGGMGKDTRKNLKINSPSKVFAEIGQGIPEGMALGIEQKYNLVEDAMDGLNDLVNNEVDDFSEIDMGFSDGTFNETMSIAMSDVVNNVLGQIVPYMQESITDAMDGIQITMDKRAFGKATRKAVANAL